MASSTLTNLAWLSLALAVVSASILAVDIATGRRQQMGVMNVVWPLTAIYSGPLALVGYFLFGRAEKRSKSDRSEVRRKQKGHPKRPMWQSALLGATHCGTGCVLGDMITEAGLYWLGATTLLGSILYTSYVFDFILAFSIGIVFQYWAIAPMRGLTLGRGFVAAMKADILSLLAFQVGMYAWMAVYQKIIFHPSLQANSPVFWSMMQIGMLAGLASAFPMNWILVSSGIKEAM
jgi:hypothetical protein